MNKIAIILFTLISVNTLKAQDLIQETPLSEKYPSIGLGTGILMFQGDVGFRNNHSNMSNFRIGYSLNVEKKFGSFSSVSANFLYGKLSQNERYRYRNLNFESPVMGGDISYVFNFDNDFILKRNVTLTPFITAGAGYIKFDPHTDLKDAKGNTYYYWQDGTIRDLPSNDSTRYFAKTISKDYEYETKLTDPKNNYKRSTWILPVSLGIKFKLSNTLDARLATTYYITGSDYIDNLAKTSPKDRFIYGQLSLDYHFGRIVKKPVSASYDVDFSAVEGADHDNDGVKDSHDNCPGTPSGVEVDGNGCPKDQDHDNVPDYRDKEPETPKGNLVNLEGVTITDQQLEQAYNDSAATDRDKLHIENPDLKGEILEESASGKIDRSLSIPEEFRPADLNKDGVISSNEITNAIDSFFQGDSGYTVEKLHRLIDFFFEQ